MLVSYSVSKVCAHYFEVSCLVFAVHVGTCLDVMCVYVTENPQRTTHSWVRWRSGRSRFTRLTWYARLSIISRRASQSLESIEKKRERGADSLVGI